MEKNLLLEKLVPLQIDSVEKSGFRTHEEWMNWADSVLPLLKYDQKHYHSFSNSLGVIRIKQLSSITIVPHLNNMIGIVKQAIIELENDIENQPAIEEETPEKEALTYPEKVTFYWLKKNVTVSFWIKIISILISIIVATFLLGLHFGQTKLYKDITEIISPKDSDK